MNKFYKHFIRQMFLIQWDIFYINSVWLGQGLFHINILERKTLQIKRLTNDFNFVSYNIKQILKTNDINAKY